MVKRLIKIAGKAAGTAKGVLFADPDLLYSEERHLVNQPFFFEGTNGKGVLLVHGWTSTPYEVRRLGKYLNENGYTVYGLQLSGHGTVPKDLENVKWSTWIQDVEEGYAKLRETCDKVFIGGTSLGSNVAMMFAKENPEVAGLVLMATPYAIRFESIAVFVAKLLMGLKKKYRKKFYPPTFGLSTTITRLISYQTYPVKSALETFDLIKHARQDLSLITQPCFVMQSTHDHIVAKNSMDKIHAQVGSKVKKKKPIEKAYHTFISDIKNEHVFEDILNFLNEN
ncbi:MAG TPA: alpha/beta fold hydrolase [Patescibacteria group bacterium]